MYVRWKVKPRANDYEPNGRGYNSKTKPVFLYVAYLVESKRIDGKPRQSTTYLASIRSDDIPKPYGRLYFWQAVQKKMQPLNLSQDTLRAAKSKLQEHVPDVTKEQLQEADKVLSEAMSRLS